jgi:hypothetical protein
MITAIGAVLLPFCLWFWRRPANLLVLVIVFSIFSASAIIVIGGLGVTPALLPTAMFVSLFAINLFNNIHYPAERQAFTIMLPFILVTIGAVASSVIMPRLFMGQVMVWPQKVSAFFVRSPLAPNAGNFTQDMYLIANAMLAATAAVYLTRPGKVLPRLLDAYFASGLLVILIALWQFASTILHIPFPSSFFLSNPGWSQLDDQTIGILTRLNGPFSEPSSLSAYMCASLSAAGWSVMNGDRRWLPRATFLGGIVVVLLSTATTGYVTMAAMAALLLARVAIRATPQMRRRVVLTAAGIGVAGGISAVALPLATPEAGQEATIILNSVLDKTQSASYRARSQADYDSLQEMMKTYGLGVGWGSNRSSSLLPGLLAAIGIWGVAGLLWFGFALTLRARQAMRMTRAPDLQHVIRGTSASLLSSLISALLSGPTISSPDFYLLLAMLVAATARARFETKTAWLPAPTDRSLSEPVPA